MPNDRTQMRRDTPKDCKVDFARLVCDYQPQKLEPKQLHITMGSDRIYYPGEVSTKT